MKTLYTWYVWKYIFMSLIINSLLLLQKKAGMTHKVWLRRQIGLLVDYQTCWSNSKSNMQLVTRLVCTDPQSILSHWLRVSFNQQAKTKTALYKESYLIISYYKCMCKLHKVLTYISTDALLKSQYLEEITMGSISCHVLKQKKLWKAETHCLKAWNLIKNVLQDWD